VHSFDSKSETHELKVSRLGISGPSDIIIEEIQPGDLESVTEMIRRNIAPYKEAGTVVTSTNRRLTQFNTVYKELGSMYLVARDRLTDRCVGGAGVGPLHGLSPGEGMGEIRDLVVDDPYRGQGIGARLLKRCLLESKRIGYERLYLETTPSMEHAQKLFIRNGFRPVSTGTSKLTKSDAMPCYYLLENLETDPQ
jgi:N-acetylglutamate synthase-like GNAT family acetyltransferase